MTAGTLSIPMPLEIDRVSTRRVYQTPRALGVVLRRQVQEREVRTWRLSWPNGRLGEYRLIRSLWDVAATALDMDWTTPDAEAIRVRFVEPPSFRWRDSGHVACSIVVEEVL